MIAATITSTRACAHDTSGGRPATEVITGWIAQPSASPTTMDAVRARAEVGRSVPRGSSGSSWGASGPDSVTRGPRGVLGRSAAEEQEVAGWSLDLEGEVLAPLHTRGVGRVEQLGDRATVGEDRVGLEVVPRLEDEGALVGARVRQPQEVLVGPAVTDDDQVDVERARGVADVAALAVEGVLDGQRTLHQPGGGERGVGEQDGVQVGARALRRVDRLRLVDRRDAR